MANEYIVDSPQEPLEYPEQTLSEFLAKKIDTFDQDDLAFICPVNDLKITFSELQRRIHKRARKFLELGITKEDIVVLFARNSLDYFLSMLALLYLGVTFSPCKPANGCYELTNQLRDSGATILVVDQELSSTILEQAMDNEKYRSAIESLKLVIVLDGKWRINRESPPVVSLQDLSGPYDEPLENVPYFPTGPDDYLVIVYTSGTTGLPKGAIHTHRSMLASMMAIKGRRLEWNLAASIGKPRQLFWYPFGHISGCWTVLKNLFLGITSVMESEMHLERLLNSVEKYQVTQLSISPGQAISLARNDYRRRFNLDTLKLITFAGSKIPLDILQQIREKYQVTVLELYGSTEMMGSVLQGVCSKPCPLGSVGVLCPGNQMQIRNLQTGQPVPAYETGEICFRGPPRFHGYLARPEDTAKTIDSNGWYRTGDIGYYDNTGHLYIVDRIKELIKFRIWSVAPTEIESFLQLHPAVESVCVVGVRHRTEGQLARAYVCLRREYQGDSVTPNQLIEQVKENLGFQNRLRGGIRFVPEIARTAIGKIDRKHYHQLVADEILTEPVEE